MPNIKSSKKSVKLDAKRHARNVFEKDRMKKAQKLVLAAIASNDAAEAKKLLPAAHKAIDQAAANNTIHKNAAARKKSKLTLKVKIFFESFRRSDFFCANLPKLTPRFSIAKEKKFAIINLAKIKKLEG